MNFLYYAIAVIALFFMGYEVYVILSRNKTILIKGSDDYFLFMILLGTFMILLSPEEKAPLASAIASICVLVTLLFQLAIKKGLTEEGLQKLFYRISYSDINEIRIERISFSRIKLNAFTDNGSRSLLFLNRNLKEIIRLCQKKGIKVYLEKDLNVV